MNIFDIVFYILLVILVYCIYFLYANRYKIAFSHYFGLNLKKAQKGEIVAILTTMQQRGDPSFIPAREVAHRLLGIDYHL